MSPVINAPFTPASRKSMKGTMNLRCRKSWESITTASEIKAAREAATTVAALNRSATSTMPKGPGQSPRFVAWIPSRCTSKRV